MKSKWTSILFGTYKSNNLFSVINYNVTAHWTKKWIHYENERKTRS